MGGARGGPRKEEVWMCHWSGVLATMPSASSATASTFLQLRRCKFKPRVLLHSLEHLWHDVKGSAGAGANAPGVPGAACAAGVPGAGGIGLLPLAAPLQWRL